MVNRLSPESREKTAGVEKTGKGELLMAYEFENQIVAKMKVSEDSSGQEAITLSGVNGQETNANSIMGGISTLLDIVGWNAGYAVRIVNQQVEETT